MWNLTVKLLKILCMFEYIETIKLPLNNIVNLGRLKKDHISRYYKLLIHFIIEMVCFGGMSSQRRYICDSLH